MLIIVNKLIKYYNLKKHGVIKLMKNNKIIRSISILLSILLIIIPFSAYGDPQEDPEHFGTAEYYSTYTAGTTIKDSYYFSDDWFLDDPEVQNDALALVSMQLVAAAVDNDENGIGAGFLKSLGFEQTGFYGFEEADPQGCNFTWGTRIIGSGDDAFTLVAVAIQSHSQDQTAKQIGWRQNFLINGETITDEQISYAAAADYAAAGLSGMKINGKVKYWITGQSRGGAIAGILAARLKDKAEGIYAYTFESPANVESEAVQDNEETYGYIHNYICSDDVVTLIPPWEMTRYGKMHILDYADTTDELFENLKMMGSDAANQEESYDPENIRSVAEKLISELNSSILSREDYSRSNTDIFKDAENNDISVTYNYQDALVSLMRVIFGNVFDGINADTLLNNLDDLLPFVTALYNAVKEDSNSSYYESAAELLSFFDMLEIEIPLSQENIYALLKLAGPVIIDPEYVPESGVITEDDIFGCIGSAADLFIIKNDLIFSHQFDAIIARLKILAELPLLDDIDIAADEPNAGEDVSSNAFAIETLFDASNCSWLTLSAEWKTDDTEFMDNKLYYLHLTLSSVGHNIPDEFDMTVNGKDPVEQPEITYKDGVTCISGIWEYVTGSPQQISISFDMNGHGSVPDPIYTGTGSMLKFTLLPDIPETVSDSSGTYNFNRWYDENGQDAENICADSDLTLYAEWTRLIDNIDIRYNIPHIGDEAGAPEIPSDAPYEIHSAYLANDDWDTIETINNADELTLCLEISPASDEIRFLTAPDEYDGEKYTGVLTVNGEEAEYFYQPDENIIVVRYKVTPAEDDQ